MRVRFRKDGALVTYLDLPAKFRKAVVSRLKIMAQLDITERRKPQDGKIEFRRFGPLDVDLRIATIPTAGGLEDIVMRVLTAATPVALDALGFDSAQLAGAEAPDLPAARPFPRVRARPARERPPRCIRCCATSTPPT